MGKRRKASRTWQCGDCGATYHMGVDFCLRPWLDSALILTRSTYRDTPLYFDTVVAQQFCPYPPLRRERPT